MNLQSIDIPSSVTSLGNYCFYVCTNLTEITIPQSVTTIGYNCFGTCSKLTDITIPSSVTSLPDFCFSNCSKLTNVNIPSSVTSLGGYCFEACTSLKEFSIHSSVKNIGYNIFKGCTTLEKLQCWPIEPPTVSTDTGAPTATCILYVPQESVESYKAAKAWENFSYIYPLSGSAPDEPKCVSPIISFANGDLQLSSTTMGAVFHYTLTCQDVASNAYSINGKISLVAAYKITAYATADGYSISDNSEATLYWIEGIIDEPSALSTPTMRGIVASDSDGKVIISGLANGERVDFYSVSGMLIGTAVANNNGEASFYCGAESGIVIAYIGNRAIKIALNN